MTPSSPRLNELQLAALARELDAIEAEARADLGEADLAHIRRVMRVAFVAEVAGRGLLAFGVDPLSFVLGTGALTLSKILENMEIGHNVMHGQYDWSRDPELDSRAYEWDIVSPSASWRHAHNFEHHTYTNVLGRDRDLGYNLVRVSAEQPWNPGYLVQPLTALGLGLFFEWGVALHDLRLEELRSGESSPREVWARARPFLRKAGWQLGKDYVFFPLLAGPNAPRVLLGNHLANLGRNLWAFAVIFCGHFPEGAEVFPEADLEDESRGHWYLRQLTGSANIEGGRAMHLLSGHLSHQIEHHLFPTVPAWRYPEMARKVREVCARWGLPYNTAPLGTQLRSVARKLLRHALPTRPRRPEPEPTAAEAPTPPRPPIAA